MGTDAQFYALDSDRETVDGRALSEEPNPSECVAEFGEFGAYGAPNLVIREENSAPSPKVKVLNSKPFGDARNTKELENLLLDMETYFQTGYVPNAEKASI
ncbi:UNVERIFIED_CONTAM: hypothetical protein Scaly_3020700 [Sesamum calycinum]|uniref:Uncharacterized protein n=1 Tax=Sesamum calycinum TaxID=2727403 RepID=A0AAW2K7B9_9LAMI